jgi:hypothetical protein
VIFGRRAIGKGDNMSKMFNQAAATLFLLLLNCVDLPGAPLNVVESVEDLKNYPSPTNGETVLVIDYYPLANTGAAGNARDRGRGGGLFRWIDVGPGKDISNVTSADDGGRYIKHAAAEYADGITNVADGIWERNFQGAVPNVKMWGAKGDGSDDTVFIRNAVRGVRANSGVQGNRYVPMGGELLFPAGLYLVSGTVEIYPGIHLRGETTEHGTRIVMKDTVRDRNIFETGDANVAARGNLRMLNVPGRGPLLGSGPNSVVDFAVGLIIENMSFWFGTNQVQHYRTDVSGAAICLSLPAETTVIRNVFVRGGGYGVRILGGGTPGLQAENLGLFYQAIAGISVEGLKYSADGNSLFAGAGGPITLKNIAGDSFSYAQSLQNSLILFTNYYPNAVITGMSVEGAYGRGVIRCIMPPQIIDKRGEITVMGASCVGDALPEERTVAPIERNFIVLENPYNNLPDHTRCMPLIALHPAQMYNVSNLIWDKWVNSSQGGRKIKALKVYNNQLPVRQPLYYMSAVTGGIGSQEERRSLLVSGDTAHYSFTPSEPGWHRVISSTQYGGPRVGGRLAINSFFDSAEVSFTLSRDFTDLSVLRKSATVNNNPLVTKVRAYSYYDSSGDPYQVGYRCALDVLVSSLSPYGTNSPTFGEYDSIELTLPLEGRAGELGSGLSVLRDPFKVSEVTDTNAVPRPMRPRETAYFSSQAAPVSIVH